MFGLKFLVFSVLRIILWMLGTWLLDSKDVALAANLQHGSAHVKMIIPCCARKVHNSIDS